MTSENTNSESPNPFGEMGIMLEIFDKVDEIAIVSNWKLIFRPFAIINIKKQDIKLHNIE